MKNLLFVTFIVYSCSQLLAQNVGIGTSSPDASAKLEISATDRGVLLPQLDLNIAIFPGGPATALLVWNTNASFGHGVGYYYNNGNKSVADWVRLEQEPNASLDDVGVIAAFPGTTYPNDMYLPLSGGTYNKADYPEFAAMISSIDTDLITDGGTTFSLANWNSNGEFLRGSGGNAASIGSLQLDATAMPSAAFSTNTGATNTSTGSTTTGNTATGDQWLSSIYNCGGCGTTGRGIAISKGYGSTGYWSNSGYLTNGYDDDPNRYYSTYTTTNHNHSVSIPSLSVNIPSLSISGGDTETRPTNRSITWVIKVKPSSAIVGTLTVNSITNPTDADWYKVGTSSAPTSNTEDVFTEGKVGIGVTAPDAPLTIGDGVNSLGYVNIKRNNDPHIHLFEGATSVARIQGNIVGGHPQFQITKGNGTNPVFVVNQDDGNVGIGVTDPDARLEVNGAIHRGAGSEINLQTAGSASAESEYNGSYLAGNAVSGTSSEWAILGSAEAANYNDPVHWQYNFNSAQFVHRIYLEPRGAGIEYFHHVDVKIYDGSKWVTVGHSSTTASTEEYDRYIELLAPFPAQQIGLWFTEKTGNNPGLKTVKMWGY